MNAEQNRLEQAREQRRQTMKPEIVDVTEQKRLEADDAPQENEVLYFLSFNSPNP